VILLSQDDNVEGELIFYERELSPNLKRVLLAPLSDVHKGNPLFSKKHFFRYLKMLDANPDMYSIPNGDLIEAAIRMSKGDIFKSKTTPQDDADWIIEQLTPYKSRILGMTDGNHEYRIYNDTGVDMSKYIAKALNVPYRPEGILLKISFGDGNNHTKGRPYTYWVYATHGYGGAKTTGSKVAKGERSTGHVNADVYLMSHDHVANGSPVTWLDHDQRSHLDTKTGFKVGKMIARRKLVVKTNAYLKWGGYSERHGFTPVDLECPVVILPGEGRPLARVLI
jgi:hypothetical protein